MNPQQQRYRDNADQAAFNTNLYPEPVDAGREFPMGFAFWQRLTEARQPFGQVPDVDQLIPK